MGCTFDLSICRKGVLVQTSTAAHRIYTQVVDGAVKTAYYLVRCITLTALPLAQQLLQIFIHIVGRSVAQQL